MFISQYLGLVDEQQKVRTITALALAALAEAATPYGIESFDSVLKPLWRGIRQHRGKVKIVIEYCCNFLATEISTCNSFDNLGLYFYCLSGFGCLLESNWLFDSSYGR